MLVDSERKNREAAEVLSSAQTKAAELTESFISRETWVKTQEATLAAKEKDLQVRERVLDEGRRLLMDREALLERNLKRNGKS
jgi:hypothetical protein